MPRRARNSFRDQTFLFAILVNFVIEFALDLNLNAK